MTVEPKGPAAMTDDVIKRLRPNPSAVVGLWCIAALGFVPAAVYLVMAPGWDGLEILALGSVWAAAALMMTRPFVVVRAGGLTYRSFGRTVHLPWAEVERVSTVLDDIPKLAVLRRSTQALSMVAVFAGATTATATAKIQSIVESAEPYLVEGPAANGEQKETPSNKHTTAKEDLTLKIEPWLRWLPLMIESIVVAIFLVTGSRWALTGALIFGATYLSASVLSPERMFIIMLRFDSTGVAVRRGVWPRRSDTQVPSDAIERIDMREGIFRPRLAILLADQLVIDVPRNLLGGRDRAALGALASQLEALSVHPEPKGHGH